MRRQSVVALLVIAPAIAGCSSGGLSVNGPAFKAGSLISCTSPAMARHCDAWLVAAERNLHAYTSSTSAPMSWTFHVGIRLVPSSGSTPAVVIFRMQDGSTVEVPVSCNAYMPGDAACDLSDTTLPPE